MDRQTDEQTHIAACYNGHAI